jgi:hypothetical protein
MSAGVPVSLQTEIVSAARAAGFTVILAAEEPSNAIQGR